MTSIEFYKKICYFIKVSLIFFSMDAFERKSPAVTEKQKPETPEMRNPQIDNALSKALMYYAAGQVTVGQMAINDAIRLATSYGHRILPSEVAYIVSGGKAEQPKTEALKPPETHDSREQYEAREFDELKASFERFKTSVSEMFRPLKDIIEIIEEESKKIWEIVEKSPRNPEPQAA